MTHDAAMVERLRFAAAPGWELVAATELAELGGFAELLQYRFLLVDLDDASCDPVEVIRSVRTKLMLNLPIFGFGGSPEVCDAARIARADRLFSRAEIAEKLPAFCEQFGW
jgi:hypothetical protein